MHYFLLLLTAKLFHRKASFGRLLAGAVLGSLSLLILLVPYSPLLTAAAVLTAPLLMILTAFRPLRPLEVFYYWAAFFIASFVAAGALSALLNYDLPKKIFASPHGIILIAAVCIAVYLIWALLQAFGEEKKWQKCLQVELQVTWQGKVKEVPAFLDTGNRLRDPFSSCPVIVIDYRSLEGLLPAQVYCCLDQGELEPWRALESLGNTALARSFTLIPYRGVGYGNGILLGFKPDGVVFWENGESRKIQAQVYLGLVRRGFGPAAEYRALLPQELLRAG